MLRGVGILTSIFCAKSDGLKFDLMTTLTSSLVRPTSRTRGMTRKGREMSLVVRYLKFVTMNSMLLVAPCFNTDDLNLRVTS